MKKNNIFGKYIGKIGKFRERRKNYKYNVCIKNLLKFE